MLCGQLYGVNNYVTVLYCVDCSMALITVLLFYTVDYCMVLVTVLQLNIVWTVVWC